MLSNGTVLKSVIVIKLPCAHFVPCLVLGAAGIRATGAEECKNPQVMKMFFSFRNCKGSEIYPGI